MEQEVVVVVGHMIQGQHLPFAGFPKCLMFVTLGFSSKQKDRVLNQFQDMYAPPKWSVHRESVGGTRSHQDTVNVTNQLRHAGSSNSQMAL